MTAISGGARLRGRIALVTGAGSGVGRASALRFSAEGARVVVADIDGDATQAVVHQIRRAGGEASEVTGDVGDRDQAAAMVTAAVRQYGGLHVLFNNAGVDLPSARSVTETDDRDWERTIRTNVTGVFFMCRAGLPAIISSGGGTVLNMASVAGMVGVPTEAAYAASKGAVIALTRQMAMDYGPAVRVNALCPSALERPTKDRHAALAENALTTRAQSGADLPMMRLGSHADVASAAVFLASDESSFITGTLLTIDGGASATRARAVTT